MDIALIGLGCRFPRAQDPLAFWDLIASGGVTFSKIPASRWNHAAFFDTGLRAVDKAYIDRGAFLDEGEIERFASLHYGLAPRRLQVTDPQHRLLLDVVRCTLADAGYEKRAWARDRAGVFIGASVSEHKDLLLSRLRAQQMFDGAWGRKPEGETARLLQEALVQDVVPVRAFSIAGNLLNMAAATVAQQYDLGGPAFSLDAACSSALVAVHQAVVNLRAGQIDLALAGGLYLNLLPDNLVGFSRIGAISRSGACRPFDAHADGFVMGEGVGTVLLKRLDDALRDGDRVYAVIKGSGCNNDGRSEGPMTPRLGGQLAALRLAYQDAKVSATSVGYLEAHGTATTVGDVVEVSALRQLFTEQGWTSATGARTALGSIKANIGHTMSAAGIAGLIKAALALHNKTLPPQPSVDEENPKLGLSAQGGDAGPFFLAKRATPWHASGGPRRAGISAFGFGGTNAHVVLEEAPERKRAARSTPRSAAQKARAELFQIAGARASIVARHARELRAALPSLERDAVAFADLAFTLTQRAHGDARLALVADSYAQLAERLEAAAAALEVREPARKGTASLEDAYQEPVKSAPAPLGPGLLFAQGPFAAEERKLALLFPGQGAQRVGLFAEAYGALPAFRQALDELDDALGPELHAELGGTLRSFLFPARADAEAARRLEETHVCQPAMAAASLALHAVLLKLGVKADVLLGHSLGEFSAAAAAGVLTPEECVRLVARRGLAMRDLPLADRGAMLSAAAGRSAASEAIAGIEGVVIANLNHPQQTVISGASAAIARALTALEARGIAVTPLEVSHAFHSPLMAGAATAMARLLADQPLRSPATALISAIDVGLYPSAPGRIAELWTRHATAPVDFAGALQSAAAPAPAGAGARLWLNVGAGGLLAGFAKATLEASDRLATAGLASRDEDGLAQLASAVGLLWAAGVPLDAAPLFEGRDAALCTLPPTTLETWPYWAIEKANKPAAQPIAVVAGEAALAQRAPLAGAAQAGEPMDPMVALFREQVALLQQHAKVLAEQAQALANRGTPLPALPGAIQPQAAIPEAPVVASQLAPAQSAAAHAPAPVEHKVATAEVAHAIVGSVARISAFPAEAVKLSQTLAADLGFDSLMTVELDAEIQKAFPTAGGIPRSMLTAATTVQDLVDHVAKAVAAPVREARPRPALLAALSALADAGPELLRFAPHASPIKVAPGDVTLPRALLVTRDALGVAEELARKLSALGHAVVLVELGAPYAGLSPLSGAKGQAYACGWPDEDASALLSRASERVGPIGGVLHLASLGRAGTAEQLLETAEPEAPAGALASFAAPLLWAHRLARAQAQASAQAAGGGMLVLATAQGGRLGLDGAASGLPVDAALAGFAKSLSRERPGELVKVVDLDVNDGAPAMANALLAELRSGNATAEVGYQRGARFEVDFGAAPAAAPLALGPGDVVLVTGGSRGLGARLAEAAARSGAAVIITGRSARDAKAEATLAAIYKAGGRGEYVQWDVTTPASSALDAARAALGPVTALVHAAGIAEDGPVGNKDDATVLRVLAPKLSGLAHALAATEGDALRLAVLVSSWSGQFGNAGQTDYAAANAALSRLATLLPALRPGLRAVALQYPPWEGTGMVANIPSLARQALAAQGVPFIDDATGERAFLAALAGGAQGEVLLALSRPARRTAHRAQIELSRARHVFLEDHQLAGQPVLPLASALDLLATAAVDAAGRSGSAPSLLVRDFQLKAPVRISESALLTLTATGEARASSELALALTVSQPGSGPRAFSRPPSYVGFATVGGDVASALASASPAAAPDLGGPGQDPALPLPLEEFYASYTFHGPRLQGIAAIEQLTPSGIVGWVKTSKPSDWIRDSTRERWTVDPLTIDAALQLAGYWAWVNLKRAGFPVAIEEYIQREPFGEGLVRVSLTLEQAQGDLVRGALVFQGKDGRVIAIARGVAGEFKHRDPRFLKARGLAAEPDEVEAVRVASPPEPAPAPVRGEQANSITAAPSTPSTIDEATYRIDQFPEVQELEQRLGLAAAFGLKNPYFNVHERVTNDTSVIGGRTMINWSSYNYLGLSGDPHVTRAAQDAAERYGTSVSASRVASGEKPLHQKLEAELSSFLGTEDSIVMVSGHGAFVTTIGHIVGPGDLILHDSLAHDCIMGGAKLSGAKRRPFPHSDFAALDRQLAQLRPHYRRVLIAVEGVYSMDGDITPLPKFIELKKKYGALLLVDEAHSIGVLGATGRGVGEHFGVDRKDVDLWMGTFSKSFASCGGYVAGSKALVQYLKYTAPGFVYSVGITPANAAAALEACKQIQLHPERVKRLHERARLFTRLAREKGIDTGMSEGSAVVPAIIGNSLHSLQLSENLRLRGINVQPIMYPAVEENAARLRFFVTSTHSEQQIRETVQVLAEELAKVRAEGSELQTGSL